MTTFKMGDSASPPSSYPSGFQAWAFYLGGDTPHVWTQEEIDAIPFNILLPIYTCDNPQNRDAAADAANFIAALTNRKVPKGVRVALDYEQAEDDTYLGTFSAALEAAGYLVMVYGAASYVFHNTQPPGGYWGAQWNNDPSLSSSYSPIAVKADQYADEGAYDASLCEDDGYWWKKTTAPVAPTPTPVDKDTAVYRAHHNTYTPVAVDGSMGPQTWKAVQYVMGVGVDGVAGPVTVTALQRYLGVRSDGRIGPVTTRAVQHRVRAFADGVWGPRTTSALQAAVNNGNF
jgi:hypothetical protein